MNHPNVTEIIASLENQEDFNVSMEGLLDVFAKFRSRIEEGKQLFKAKIEPKIKLNVVTQCAQRNMHRSYDQMKELVVPCPRGLAIPLSDYVTILADGAQHILQARAVIIPAISHWMASAMTDPNAHSQLTTRRQQFTKLEGIAAATAARLGSALTPETAVQHHEMPYGKMFVSNNQWGDISRGYQQIQGALTNELHTYMREQHDSLAHRSNMATDQLIRSYKDGKLSKQYMVACSEMMQIAAREFEFYGLIRHMATELEVALGKLAVKV